MKSGTFIILILILLFVQEANAQKALYLKPHVGVQTSINHIIQNKLADPKFNIYKLHVNPEIGFQLYYDLNESLSYYGGFSFNRIKINIGTGSGNRGRGNGLLRFPFGVQKKLKTFGLLESRGRPLVLIDMKLNAGISLDAFPYDVSDNWASDYQNMHVRLIDTNKNPGYSVFAGLTFQFFNFQKNHVQLSILYSQGINRKMRVEVDYQINNQNYSAEIGSRSSFLGVQIAYPFKLIDFSKQKGKS